LGPYEGNSVPFETVVVELSKLGFDGIEEKREGSKEQNAYNDCSKKITNGRRIAK
jgi:hypothetical protein